MRRYNVPRLAFVNKCDRAGADPFKVSISYAFSAQRREQREILFVGNTELEA